MFFLGCAVLEISDEPETAAGKRLDNRLRLAVITNRAPGRIDTAVESAIRNNPPVPYYLNNLILAHNSVAVFDQAGEQAEHLRFDLDGLAAVGQFQALGIERELIKSVDQFSSFPGRELF